VSFSARVREHIRTNVVGYIALFCFAMGGTAFAIEANSVRSKHIANGQVRTADLADGSVAGAKLAGGSVTSEKILDGSVGGADLGTAIVQAQHIDEAAVGAEELGEGVVGSDEVGLEALNGDDIGGLTGADIDESSFGTVPDSNQLAGRAAARYENQFAEDSTLCSGPSSSGSGSCASVSITVPAASTVFATASVEWVKFADGSARARCRLMLDGVEVAGTLRTFGDQATGGHRDGFFPSEATIQDLISVPAGTHTIDLDCTQAGLGNTDTIKFGAGSLIAFRLSG
jgi:hypothetical protein